MTILLIPSTGWDSMRTMVKGLATYTKPLVVDDAFLEEFDPKDQQ